MTLLERLNVGVLEDKGIWRDHFVPNSNELEKAVELVESCKHYKTPNGMDAYHTVISGVSTIVMMKENVTVKKMKGENADKAVTSLSKCTFVSEITDLLIKSL